MTIAIIDAHLVVMASAPSGLDVLIYLQGYFHSRLAIGCMGPTI